MRVLVARIGKAHGLRGEVTVQEHTDSPDERFAVGEVLDTEPESVGPLTVRSSRLHGTIRLLGFEEALDRTAAEALRGTRLFADVDVDAEGDDEDDEGWYEDELLGLEVVDPAGERIGTVRGLEVRPAQDLLVVELADGREALVPFVEEIVPEVDPGEEGRPGRVVLDAPLGLLDPDVTR